MKKADLITLAALAGTAYAGYKLISWLVKSNEEEKKKKEEFEAYKKERLAANDFRKLIRDASTFNKHLDAHQRNIAYDILNASLYDATEYSEDKDDFDDSIDKLQSLIDIFMSDDEQAILSMIERREQNEEKRKLNAEREHELAVVRAAGEKELKLAKIAADAEKSKASSYSSAIMSGAELVKEVVNERSTKPED